ncbi:MAG: hypothetical protein ABEK01_02565 [Candidatus Nanohaloarchaea archaeon]
MRKGQMNLEFLFAAIVYFLAIAGVVVTAAPDVDAYEKRMADLSENLEAVRISYQAITSPGHHDYGSGGTDWESTANTRANIDGFGLASGFKTIDAEKLRYLQSVGGGLSYLEFRNITGADKNYRFIFTWYPVVETFNSYRRGTPPSDPPIVPPSHPSYTSARQTVHYGNVTLLGQDWKFLVVRHDEGYDEIFYSADWDFSGTNPHSTGDSINLGREFVIENIMNRGSIDQWGRSFVLKREVKRFGGTRQENPGSTVEKINRYAAYDHPTSELQPMKVEVLVW